jgi:hydrogenase maturation protein HypF
MAQAPAITGERLRVRVRGAVQGVGFRPFVFGLATRYGLSGFVLNDGDGVLAEIEGDAQAQFLSALQHECPVLARVDGVEVTRQPALGCTGFVIRESLGTGAGSTHGIPDAATCPSCLADLFDPTSRFYRYPFVTCTDCGPRFTITRHQPYDRANTAMADFPLCRDCAADYADPASRRFHAETIACPACGPRLSHPIPAIAGTLRAGGIVALKGIGGFHLFCDATNEAAVARLRLRKKRPDRPFAIMIASDGAIEPFARPTMAERGLLDQSARPIVLVRKGAGLAPSVAPRLGRVGIMLPSAPLHHLVFDELAQDTHCALVATSANISGDPLVIADDEAATELSPIADLIVTHDRPILQRADDSVIDMIAGAPAFIRRARGFVPEPIDLGDDGPVVIGLGAHLKATVCVTRGREAFVSQHLGDLDTARTLRFYGDTVARLLAELGVRPELVACDLHPDYRSTLFAETLDRPVLRVQHHAAHLAAVAAEHQLHGPLIGLALDGHGHGADGSAWGGELMCREGVEWCRVGHLLPLAMPGGDRAAREPWRMGVAAMVAVGRGGEAALRFSRHPLAGPLARMISAHAQSPVTTSMGRLFDAAAALLGLCETQSYEGQAAMELEAAVGSPEVLAQGFRIWNNVLDFTPLLAALMQPGVGIQHGAELFHGTIIAGLAEWAGDYASRMGQTRIVLGGGCFMNPILTEGLAGALRQRGLTPWLPRALPANDGAISFGQAAIARAQLIAGHMAI